MTAFRGVRAVWLALLVSGAMACRTAPSRFYTLASTAAPGQAPPAGYAVVVGPVTVPASVDQPEIVVQVSPNQVRLDEFNRWASPLGDGIARVVAGDLATLLGTSRVVTAPLPSIDPAYRVSIDVQRFDSALGTSAVIDAVWVVRRVADGKSRAGRTVAQETPKGDGFDALAAAHSQALAQVSRDIADAIQAEATQPPPSSPATSSRRASARPSR